MARQLVILGTSVTLPDPASVSDLAARFQAQGGQLAEAETTLQALARPDAWGEWTGQAADAFGQSIGQLPADLGDVRDAYEEVATALRQYAGQLEPVVGALSSLSYPAEEAEYTLAATERARAQAIAHGQTAAIPAWNIRVADAAEAVAGLRRRLNGLLAELNALAATCTRQIKAAEPKTAHKSLFGQLESEFVRDVADPVGHGVVDAGKAGWHMLDEIFLQPFSHLVADSEQLWNDPDLHTMGQVLQDVGDVAGVIGLVVLVAAVSIGTGGTADALFLGVDALACAAMASHVNAFGFNLAASATHEQGAGVDEVVNSGLSVASDAGGRSIGNDLGDNLIYSVGTGVDVTVLTDEFKHVLSLTEAAPDAPDVTSGLDVAANSVQPLQGLPVVTGPAAGPAGVLQPAVSVPSPAVVNIQHVALTPLQGAPAGGASGLEGNM